MEKITLICYPMVIIIGLVFVFLLYHAIIGWSVQKKLVAVLNQRHELRKCLTVKNDEIRVMRTLYEMNFEEVCWLVNVEVLPKTQLILISERLSESQVAVDKAKYADKSSVAELQWRVDLYQSLLKKLTQNIEIRKRYREEKI